MATTEHMATPEDDRRHAPGPGARPLWSESYWFPLYDPEREIGVVLRAGMYMKRGDANLYLIVTHKGAIVHAVSPSRDETVTAPASSSSARESMCCPVWSAMCTRLRARSISRSSRMRVLWKTVNRMILLSVAIQ